MSHKIREFRHRLRICSEKDVVNNGNMSLSRDDIYSGWAKIEPKKSSQFAGNGVAISGDARTHKIYMNYRRDMQMSGKAWLYEERLQSAPRWFKILSVIDDGCYWCFDCKLTERGDGLIPPQKPVECVENNSAVSMPKGVRL